MTVFTARTYGSDTNQVSPDPTENNINGIPWYVMLRQSRYKYIRNLVEGEIEELYDLHSDPNELHNLAIRKDMKPTLRLMREATVDELRRTDAGIVHNLPTVSTD